MKKYASHTLPNFVHDYLGRPVQMTKTGRYDWVFEGSRHSLLATGRGAAQARANVALKVSGLDGKTDKRRASQ